MTTCCSVLRITCWHFTFLQNHEYVNMYLRIILTFSQYSSSCSSLHVYELHVRRWSEWWWTGEKPLESCWWQQNQMFLLFQLDDGKDEGFVSVEPLDVFNMMSGRLPAADKPVSFPSAGRDTLRSWNHWWLLTWFQDTGPLFKAAVMTT